MDQSEVLRKALELLGDDLSFQSLAQVSKDPDGIFSPLLGMPEFHPTPEEARDKIIEQVRMAFLFCVKGGDVYHRVRGDKAFYHLIAADWNPATPSNAASIEKVVTLFVDARRRYLAHVSSEDEPTWKLTISIDQFIAIIDGVNSTVANRTPRTINPPRGVDASSLDRIWPPPHFSPLDIAIMAEATTRKALFGVDHENKGGDDDLLEYPHDQRPPLYVRQYLSRLSLAETKPDSDIALFLAPVAFIDDEQRQLWHKPTGHKSRFYATVDEFLEYAKLEFRKTGKNQKHHVIGLLTPWFAGIDKVTSDAQKNDKPIPTWWQDRCLRSGMMVCVSRIEKDGFRWNYRVVVFKPNLPRRNEGVVVLEKWQEQLEWEDWVTDLLDKTDERFRITEGFIGGRALHHVPAPAGRHVRADQVELSCEIVTEMMEEPGTIPTTREQLYDRGFQVIWRYRDF
ncbi:hypothetical protein F4819DRAFT_497318 [Hypoxylon fuscum]|nr:hypothetical protein F4819DRAFT_497318 [Hypoxylon fuscum]